MDMVILIIEEMKLFQLSFDYSLMGFKIKINNKTAFIDKTGKEVFTSRELYWITFQRNEQILMVHHLLQMDRRNTGNGVY